MSNELIDNILSEKRKPVIKQNGIWLYPYTIENRYISYVKNIFSVFSSFVVSRYMPNIPGWSRSQKEDGIIIDEWLDDIDELNGEYTDLQNQVFIESKDQITEELAVFAYLISTFNKKQQVKIVSKTLNIPTNIVNTALIKEPWEDALIKSWISNNVSLIKGLSDEYIKKINNALITGLQQDLTIADLEQSLRDINKDFSVNRTRLIARDQTNKLNGILMQKRQQDIGADIYQWGTARDERVRVSHKAMNDKYCTWSDKTVYADTLEDAIKGNWKKRSSIGGVEKHPGEDIQCRCYASIVFVDPERTKQKEKTEVKKESSKEPTKIKSGKKKIGSEIPKKETQKEKTERLKQELEQKKERNSEG